MKLAEGLSIRKDLQMRIEQASRQVFATTAKARHSDTIAQLLYGVGRLNLLGVVMVIG